MEKSFLDCLMEQFPRTENTKHSAFCERIPINVFDAVESLIRPEMRARGFVARYRGPRVPNYRGHKPSMTKRRHATHVLLYLG